MQLQKAPSGLLGWFALKVGGYNPPAFSDAVIPVVEVGDHYLATSELQLQAPSAGVTTGLAASWSTNFTVPAGKVWRLIGAGAYTALNAADVALILEGIVGILSPISGPILMPAYTATMPQVAGQLRAFGTTFRPPVFLPSGWSVQLNMQASAATTVSVPWFPRVMTQEFDL